MTQQARELAVVVSKTHWDRAWYQPFQVFRLQLVQRVDQLLQVLEEDPEFQSFMLDGQMLPVEDYLEIRPERRADIERMVSSGHLYVGPWYVLADEYLVSPEALIRNLQMGIERGQQLGGVMYEGYVPDSFGHISQLPQILKGFGIESALFWRGVGEEGKALGNEFWWEAPDGSRVLAIHLRDGYHNAGNLGYPMRWGDPGAVQFDMSLALTRLQGAVRLLAPHSRAGVHLLLNGVDHAAVELRVPQILKRANEASDGREVRFVHGTLPSYIAAVRESLDAERLPVYCGEFNRDSYTLNLQGVYSSRMYLQQANEQAQTSLECYAEPLSAWSWLLGNDYPQPFLSLAWRKLLQNHPHDDICGCSVDAVHREDMARFDEVKQLSGALAHDGLRAVVRRIDRTSQPGVPYVFYNPAAHTRSETAELTLIFDADDEFGKDFHLVTAGGEVVLCQRLAEEQVIEAQVGRNNPVRRVRIAVALEQMPPCGYRAVYALQGPPTAEPAPAYAVRQLRGQPGMENGLLRLVIESDGVLTLVDLRSGRRFEGLTYFVDDEDAGDEYDYSPAQEPQQISSRGQEASIRLLHSGPLQVTYEITQQLELPEGLTDDQQRRSLKRVTCSIVTQVTLRHGAERVELRTTVENHARDHRLRVCFPSGIDSSVSHADGHFDVLERPIEAWGGDGRPVPTRHQRYFVDLSDGRQGLAIFNRGLAEYEVLPQDGRNVIAVTLLRCVGALSRNNLRTRHEHAGPALPTPEAQCLGRHTFEYAIAPHDGDWRAIYGAAYGYRAPVIVQRGSEYEGYLPSRVEREAWPAHQLIKRDLSGNLPAELSFLSLEADAGGEGSQTLTLSAVKKSERGERLVVRFYNPAGESTTGRLRLYWPIRRATLVNLNEEKREALAVEGEHVVPLTVAAGQVVTVALELSDQSLL